MSDSAPAAVSSQENETASEPPLSPPPPSQSSESSPPPPSPPTPSSNSSSSGSSPPPSTPPPTDESSAPPPPTPSPPPIDDSSSKSPPPPPPASNDSPSAPPPPSDDLDKQPPPSPASPPSSRPSPSSPPPSDSPVAAIPPPGNPPTSPLPPSPPPPGQTPTPSKPETPVDPKTPPNPPPPPLESPPLLSTPNASPPSHTPRRPSPSTPSAISPPKSTSDRTPASKEVGTSPSTSSEKSSKTNSSLDSGTVISIGISVALIIAVVAYCCLKKKKRRMDAMEDIYRPPPSFSVRSDGYYRQGNSMGFSSNLDPYYATRPPPSPSNGLSHDSFLGHGGYQQGTPDPGAKSWFSYEELMEITNGFSRENLIGEGGFGCVYKGMLQDGRRVAVKQLKAGSGQGEREFRAEVEIISRVHHRHLVSLVGYCIAEYHRLLVYEFVPNNTLEHHLHGRPVMNWSKRLKIAIGSARGLAYLHEDCHPRIIHRDIKSANILLDDAWEAQVADFGLAKLSNDTHTHVSTRVMGTFGYMAPEYASSGKLTDRSDVFSFGVVLLELITGRKPVDPSQPLGDESLVEWARPLLVHALETGDFEQLVDPSLENNFAKGEMLRMIEVAAACVRHSAPKRPRMVQVLRALDNEGEMADLSNGVKFGQSTVFDSGQYSADIRNFRRMAFGSGDHSAEYGHSGEQERRSSAYSGQYERRTPAHSGEHERPSSAHGGEFHGRDAPRRPPNPRRPGEMNSGEYSRDAEARAMSRRGSDRSSPHVPPNTWRDGSTSSGEHSNESETRAMFPRANDHSDGSYRYHGGGFE